MACRRYRAQFSAAWNALFELFVPIETKLGPAYCPLPRERAIALRPEHGGEIGPETTRVALGAAL